MKINLGPFLRSAKEYRYMLSFFTLLGIVTCIVTCASDPSTGVTDDGTEYVCARSEDGYKVRASVITVEGRDYVLVIGSRSVAICPVTP